MRGNETFKTLKTPEMEVSEVLRVHSGQEPVNFSPQHRPPMTLQRSSKSTPILEYDEELSREEAERVARTQL
jgi:hypothetical protein